MKQVFRNAILILLICTFGFFQHITLQQVKATQDVKIKAINTRLDILTIQINSKADKKEIRLLQRQAEGYAQDVKELRQDFNGWQGMWDALFP